MLLAGNDSSVGTAKCQAMAEKQMARGFIVEVQVYREAQHGYAIDPGLIYGYDARYDAPPRTIPGDGAWHCWIRHS